MDCGASDVIKCYWPYALEVENSFIDYFGKDTEIYKGMSLFDEKLGGTLSMDVHRGPSCRRSD